MSIPNYHDFVCHDVPENVSIKWHNSIHLLRSHAIHMAEVIEEQSGDRTVLKEAAANFREAMKGDQ